MKSRPLDFIVIGAMKCGTTSLHEYLKQHPQVYLPAGKEVPYFGNPRRESRGWDQFIKTFFSGARSDQKLGVVSPQYMYYPSVAEKIYRQCPEAKIIAVLRNPIERALSHYKMLVRAYEETRNYETVITEQLTSAGIHAGRTAPTPDNSCVTLGEYGRILADYESRFTQKNMLIIFADELEKQPRETMVKIYNFLDLPVILPKNLATKYHTGQPKFTQRALAGLLNKRWIRFPLRILLPEQLFSQITIRGILHRDSTIAKVDLTLTPATEKALVSHYAQDQQQLKKFAAVVPWAYLFEQLDERCRQ